MDVKKLLVSAGIIWMAGEAPAQSVPTVIALYPNKAVASDELAEELRKYEKSFEITDEIRASFVDPDLPGHWKRNRSMTLEFLREQDSYGLLTKTATEQLTYLLNDFHEVLICFPVRETSAADLKNYRLLADKYEVAWVVNFTSVELVAGKETATLKAGVHLYNKPSNMVWINKDYTSECVDPLDCLSRLTEQCAQELFDLMEEKRHYW